ncbi:FAD-dependent oxidoreductase [Leptospira sp. GIMC2001]|uniref:FAD-dependent oxidoreductase n=1 Tax=Leptospira sp. GIMC2001 TaxID=1513297 RepID=UPI00234B1326|nr:FAD-dependent oxidoreductase [Leptospira sp. GIMC2001]WCL47945.1 FAD-dependent oxidoreductase [Leptospira sp. GIMC2001]
MKKNRIIIVGGALAGPVAASRAREIDENAEIILLERNTRVSYALAGLSFYLSEDVKSLEDLNREREDFFKSVYNIDVLTKTEVISLNRKSKTLLIRNSETEKTLEYDRLIFATGAGSLKPANLPDIENFRYFRTLDDLDAIQKNLINGANRFIVLGGGSMGLEATDGLVRGGGKVTLIEKNEHILPHFSKNIASLAEHSLKSQVDLICGYREIEFKTQNRKLVAVIVDGKEIETDFLVCAIGVRPRTELLAESGLKLNPDGSIPIDKNCRTTDKNIYACSICVSLPESFSSSGWIPQAAIADKTAQVAGANAVGLGLEIGKFTGSMIVRLPNTEVGRVGLSEDDIRNKYKKGKWDKVFIQANNIESYMPNASPIFLEIFYKKGSCKILGLEAIGRDIKSRLDSCAVAIQAGMNLEELSQVDFSYSPAFGTSRDALNVVSTVAMFGELKLTDWIEPQKIINSRNNYFIVDVGVQESQNKIADFYLKLEDLRSNIQTLIEAYNQSKATEIAIISNSGRRGHLALRILDSYGLKVKNVAGGFTLFSALEKSGR